MSGPFTSGAGFLALVQAQPMYLLFRPAAGAGGAHRAGVGWGVAGHFLGFSSKGSAQRGAQGKSPRLSGDSLWETRAEYSHENRHKSCNKTRRERERNMISGEREKERI